MWNAIISLFSITVGLYQGDFREIQGAERERERRRETYLKILFPDPCFLRFLVLKLAFVDVGRACFASEDELLRQERLGESGEET
jgi:hypothetical protein